MSIKNSFSSANIDIPIKLVKNADFTNTLSRGFVIPYHIQWMPTNKCDADCSFCSCANRNKGDELDINESRKAIEAFANLGTKAVTITGGGEPMLYRDIYSLIEIFCKNDIEVGLVTNGKQYLSWDLDRLNNLRWLRMSISDEYDFGEFSHKIDVISGRLKSVDFAISYVVTNNPDITKMIAALEKANYYKLSHIRFVLDICKSGELDIDFDEIFSGMNTSRAIFQKRQDYCKGSKQCLISLAKPVIGADGGLYPCCGVQYASVENSLDLPDEFVFGTIKDIETVWKGQYYFDGSVCEKCYYSGYNSMLGAIRGSVRHIKFI